MKIHLCDPIGPYSTSAPENVELYRLVAFLKHNGYSVSFDDLKIKILSRFFDENLIDSFVTNEDDKLYKINRESIFSSFYEYLLNIARLKAPQLFKKINANKPDGTLSEANKIINGEIKKWVKKIILDDIDLVGFSFVAGKVLEATEKKEEPQEYLLPFIWAIILAQAIKKRKQIPIFVGDNAPRIGAYSYVKGTFESQEAVDFIIFEDFEKTLLDYLKRIENGGNTLTVPGTITKTKGGKIICNSSRGLVKNLDRLPYPDYSGIRWDLYKKVFGSKQIYIYGSIGCSERCTFCNEWSYRNEYISRSPEHVVGEIMNLKQKYDVNFITFKDRLINVDIHRLEKICNLLISNKINVPWFAYAKVTPHMTKKLLTKMHRGGCKQISWSIESGSPKIIKKMGKKFSLKEASRVLKDATLCEIENIVPILTDFPGEGEKEFNETIKFIEKNLAYIKHIRINRFRADLSKEVYLNPEKYGLVFRDGNFYPKLKNRGWGKNWGSHMPKFVEAVRRLNEKNNIGLMTKNLLDKNFEAGYIIEVLKTKFGLDRKEAFKYVIKAKEEYKPFGVMNKNEK